MARTKAAVGDSFVRQGAAYGQSTEIVSIQIKHTFCFATGELHDATTQRRLLTFGQKGNFDVIFRWRYVLDEPDQSGLSSEIDLIKH